MAQIKFNEEEIAKLSIANMNVVLDNLDFIIENKETYPDSSARLNSISLRTKLEQEIIDRITKLIII